MTDAPRAFHLASLLAAVGTAASRRSYFIDAGRKAYLNLWVMLVGPSASRKSTAAGFGLQLYEGISEHLSDRALRVNRKIASIQGLLQFMSCGTEMCASRTVLDYEDEISTLLAKSKRDPMLKDLLLELHACPARLTNRTMNTPIEVKDAFLSMLACGVDTVLPDLLRKEQVKDGFLNRWAFFVARRDRKMPRSRALDDKRFNLIIKLLARRLHETEGEISLSTAAGELFDTWDTLFDDQRDELLGRTPNLVRKYACVYAIMSGTTQVEIAHVRAAITLALYNYECARRLNGKLGKTVLREREDRFLEKLLELGGEQVGLRDVYKPLDFSSAEGLETALALQQDGSVKIDQGRRKDQRLLRITDAGRSRLTV